MIKALFLIDSYLKESPATIVSVKDGKYVTLDQTIFYAKGGGQSNNTGKIIKCNEVYNVVYIAKFSGEISHAANHVGLQTGDDAYCILSWGKRRNSKSNQTSAYALQ